MQASIQQDETHLTLLIQFLHIGVTLSYMFSIDDEDDRCTVIDARNDLKFVRMAVQDNRYVHSTCERLFDKLTYIPKDEHHRSGKFIILCGNVWEHQVCIELLADELVDDLIQLGSVLDTMIEKQFLTKSSSI
jgi:hypothetical protein